MAEMNHTPTPWHAAQGFTSHGKAKLKHMTVWAGNEQVQVHGLHRWDNAAFIVRAVNAHDALVEALEWLTLIADNLIPCDCPSNYELHDAELAISAAHKLLEETRGNKA